MMSLLASVSYAAMGAGAPPTPGGYSLTWFDGDSGGNFYSIASSDHGLTGQTKIEFSTWIVTFPSYTGTYCLFAVGSLDTYVQILQNHRLKIRFEGPGENIIWQFETFETVPFEGIAHIYVSFDCVSGDREIMINGQEVEYDKGNEITAFNTDTEIRFVGEDIELFGNSTTFQDYQGLFADFWLDTPTTFNGIDAFIDRDTLAPKDLSTLPTPYIWFGGDQTLANINTPVNNGSFAGTITNGSSGSFSAATDPYSKPMASYSTMNNNFTSAVGNHLEVLHPVPKPEVNDLQLMVVTTDAAGTIHEIRSILGFSNIYTGRDAGGTDTEMLIASSRSSNHIPKRTYIDTIDNGTLEVAATQISIPSCDEVHVLGTAATAISNSLVVPGVTTTKDNCILFIIAATDGGDAMPDTPAGWTRLTKTAPAFSTGDIGHAIFYKEQVTSGTEPDVTLSMPTSDGIQALMLAAAPGGPDDAHRYWRVLMQDAYDDSYMSLQMLEMASSIGGADLCTTGQTIFGTQRSGFDASHLFDGLSTTEWSAQYNSPISQDETTWAGQDFGGTPQSIAEIRMRARDDSFFFHSPSHFLLQYSDDNVLWNTKWAFNNQPVWDQNELRTFNAPESAISQDDATHWRLKGGFRDNSAYLHVAELEMRETVGGADVTTTGEAISGDQRSGFEATKAFDDTISGNNSWGVSVSTGANHWVGQNFATARRIEEFVVSARADSFANQTPRTMSFQKSLDGGTTWETVFNVNSRENIRRGYDSTWSASESRTFQMRY